LYHASVRPNRVAIREKDLGIWQSWTWREVRDQAHTLAGGLAALGLARDGHLAIIGENRPRLYWSIMAAQSLGAVPVPLYQDSIAQELAFVLADAEVEIAVVEDQEQVDKLLEILPQCPKLKYIVYDDPRGMRSYRQPQLLTFEAVQERGQTFVASQPEFWQKEIAQGRAGDTAALFYTSGTTGHPKGVVLTHANLIEASRAAVEMDHLTADDEVLAYLPLAWIGQNIFSYVQALIAGYCVNCPESAETVTIDTREVGPTYYFAPPRVLEALLTQVMIRMEDASWIKRKMFHYFMAVARRVGVKLMDGSDAVGVGDHVLYAIGSFLVYGPLRNSLGMNRVRVAYTAGEAIGPDLFVFYRSIGINLKQLYGSTETSVFVCVQPDGQVKPDTVGPPVKGVQVKIADSGEILLKGPGLFQNYYKNPQATAEAKDAEGWFHTGDAGFFDTDGHLRIIDRAKDVGRMRDATLFAPKYLENKLKFFPYIKEAVVFGHDRNHAAAIINFDMAAVGDWAERRNLSYSGYTDLASKQEVYALIRDCIEKVNQDLAHDPKLCGSQMNRFVILHKELDADDGELTRTRKVRRRIVAEKYAKIVEALYTDKPRVALEIHVQFEDGRAGTVRADLEIHEARTFAATAPTPTAQKRQAVA
ncbi:MAG: long-chain fatty acid--CoA ligase, partial [Candidatus Muproteobacteria bacterium RBG_16_60_9]